MPNRELFKLAAERGIIKGREAVEGELSDVDRDRCGAILNEIYRDCRGDSKVMRILLDHESDATRKYIEDHRQSAPASV